MKIKKTPLFDLHKFHGAKFVQFAGYEMPIQYKTGIIEEHNLTRSKSGIFDVSHMGQLFIEGEKELTKDLEKIFPIDLLNLQINQSKYSFLMKDNGGIYDDLIITKLEGGFMIILNAACKDNDLKVLKLKLGNKYNLKLSNDLSLVAIQGPDAKNILEKLVPKISKLKFMQGNKFKFYGRQLYITRSGYTGEDGFEVSIPNVIVEIFVKNLIELGSNLVGLGARDTLRLEAGLCLYGHDINEETSPIEANLKWAISKNRIDTQFLGSETIKKQIEEGVKKLRVGIKPESRVIARETTKIFDEQNNEIGKITSGTFGPSVQSSVAMGYVGNAFSKINTKIFLEVRGKKYPANICNLPFYKKSYVKGATNE
tara:strand:+ start:2341 stop:3447 length:1107 start_codon:yes stop_codon:yes gene_type:complete